MWETVRPGAESVEARPPCATRLNRWTSQLQSHERVQTRMNPLRTILLTAVTTALLLPTAASAATVSRQGDQIRYEAASGERNHVIGSTGNNDDEIGFSENSPSDLQAGPGCPLVSRPQDLFPFVTCARSGVTGIEVNLGNDN